tara:strand:- start:1276 stop:2703 length:1428 start_codon:yes stop_codon:yes gene_type:complete
MADAQTYKVNNAEFEGKFTLKQAAEDSDSPEQKGVEISFSKSAIRGMDIEENFLEPFTNGNIYINNPLDFIEDGSLIRGDGRDVFEVEFYPKGDDFMALKYEFVISSELNSTSKTDRLNNYKTYSLLDRSYFKLSEKIPYGRRFRGKVGVIIRSILEEKDIAVAACDGIGDWEFGDMEIDLLPEHILPPSTFRYSDLVKYLLKINYKKVGDTYVRLFLNWCRICKEYKYRALSDIFAKPVPIEQFMANDLVAELQENVNNPATGPGKTKTNVNNAALQNSDFSSPMLVYTNAFLHNMLVSRYDAILGEHSIDLIRIKDVKEKWTKLFVDPFKYVGGKAQPWLVLNNVKQEEIFRNLGFPFPGEKMAFLAEAELTSNMTFFNLQLNINTLGDTQRQPGDFIDISTSRPQKEDSGKNPFDSGKAVDHRSDAKLLGSWFMTKVRHEFNYAKVDGYTNIMQCIKPHIGPGTPAPSDCVD